MRDDVAIRPFVRQAIIRTSTVEEQTALHRKIAVPPLVTNDPGKGPDVRGRLAPLEPLWAASSTRATVGG